MDTNTLQTLNNLGNKLDNYIQITAEKLGQTADHFWPIFVRQQRLEGIWFLAVITIGTFILTKLIIKSWKALSKAEDDDIKAIGYAGLTIGTGVLILFIAIVGLHSFTQIVNPEFGAFQQLIQSVKS